MNQIEDQFLVSVVIPVYNTPPKLLRETLDSVKKQTLDKDLFEVLIINDCSPDPVTQVELRRLEGLSDLGGIHLRVIHHETNKWLAEVRNTGIRESRGKYIVNLDSDDLIAPSYLKKCALTMEAHPGAGWAYPNLQTFESLYYFATAPDFNAKKLFWGNYCACSSMFRKSAWLTTRGQRTEMVTENVKWFEDWEFYIQLMKKGWYGVPVRDTTFYYRRRVKSMITRSRILLFVSCYLIYRTHIWGYWKLNRAQRNQKRDIQRGKQNRHAWWSPSTWLNRFSGHLITQFKGRPVKYYPFTLFFQAIFSKHRFIKNILAQEYLPTSVEADCGLLEKRNFDFDLEPVVRQEKKSVLFAHYWWRMGGAENVFLDWVKAARDIDGVKLINLVCNSYSENEYLKPEFEEYMDEQYALDKLSTNPMASLRICWNLIVQEQPKVIYNMHNPFIYCLTPLIKQKFPQMQIIDLLHCEGYDDPAWFGAATDYQQYLDKRIVISDFWKEVLIDKYEEKAEKVEVMMNALDLKRFDPTKYDKKALRKQFKLPQNKIVVGFLGRFEFQKNPHTFLELAELFHDDRRFQFVMVGSGSLEKEVKSRVKRLSNLTYLGYTKKPEMYYSLFDVVVFPSVYEGYPMVGLEAAAMKVPIIATNITGFREQIDQGNFGVLYDQEQPKKDARKIRDLLYHHQADWESIGERGRDFVEREHDYLHQKEVYKQFFEDLLK
ncbi:MAG: glycosyltransferase [Candidatus Gracilibacteria bacterium]|nr:glycosyltransferase [Candidatus Gracilibacteria bacterium]